MEQTSQAASPNPNPSSSSNPSPCQIEPYTTDIFNKYKAVNMIDFPTFKKYYIEEHKIKKNNIIDIFDKPDVCARLNTLIMKRGLSNEDEKLYNTIRYNLNKVNNKMGTGADGESKLAQTIESLTTLQYSKIDHFQKLANMIIEKAVNEHKFCSIYARICAELAPYYIETSANTKIGFKSVLLNTCQKSFVSFLSQAEKLEKEKLSGLMSLIGELYTRKLLTLGIINVCFDRLYGVLEKYNIIADGISGLILAAYPVINAENNEIFANIMDKIKQGIVNPKLHIRSKFTLQNIIDVVEKA